MKIQETLGYKIGRHRLARDWSEGEFATNINAQIKTFSTVTEETVREWETNKKVPEEEMLEVIVDVLIKGNLQLNPRQQKTAEKELRIAAAKTREAIQSNTLSQDFYAWGDAFYKLRKQGGFEKESQIAEAINEYHQTPLSAFDVHDLEHNIYPITIGLMKACIDALSMGEQKLSSKDINDLWERFSEEAEQDLFKATIKGGKDAWSRMVQLINSYGLSVTAVLKLDIPSGASLNYQALMSGSREKFDERVAFIRERLTKEGMLNSEQPGEKDRLFAVIVDIWTEERERQRQNQR